MTLQGGNKKYFTWINTNFSIVIKIKHILVFFLLVKQIQDLTLVNYKGVLDTSYY
jgi:hypothetical protein